MKLKKQLNKMAKSSRILYALQKEIYQRKTEKIRRDTKEIRLKIRKLINIQVYFKIRPKKELERYCTYKKIIAEKKIVTVRGPIFYNYSVNTLYKQFKKLRVTSPRIEIKEYVNVYAYGKTNFLSIRNSKNLFLDDGIDINSTLAATTDGKLIKIKKNYKLEFKKSKRKINKAILLSGQCSGNYAHWITELLPKICYADTNESYNDYPLVIDNWAHPVFERSAILVSNNAREIIKINPYERCNIKRVLDVSMTSYIPVEINISNNQKFSPYQFSKDALERLRLCVLSKINKSESSTKKIFLKRDPCNVGNNRLLINTREIEEIAENNGYTIMDPAYSTFEDQAFIFSKATHIISPIGAALSNLVFNNRNCNVMILSPHFPGSNYSFFSSLLGVLDHNIKYLLGNQVNERGIEVQNRCYYISKNSFKESLLKF
jgi:hypothetical protein